MIISFEAPDDMLVILSEKWGKLKCNFDGEQVKYLGLLILMGKLGLYTIFFGNKSQFSSNSVVTNWSK